MPNKKQKKRVLDFLSAVEWAFELNNYDRNIVFSKEPKDVGVGECQAEIHVDYSYKNVNITIYPSFWKENLEEQRKILLHELCHSIVASLTLCADNLLDGLFVSRQMIDRENERTTSAITHLLDMLLTGNMKYFKKAYKDYLKK